MSRRNIQRSIPDKFNKKQTLVSDFESYHLDILGLTETWLPGNGVDILDGGHVLYRAGGQESRAVAGVLVHRRLKNNVISYKFHSDCLTPLCLRRSPKPDSKCITVISCYAPTLQRSLSNPEQADLFNSILESVICETKKRDELFILGDFNAKVGSAPPGTSGAVGCFSKHTVSNANGERLLDFCNSNRLLFV